MGVNAKAFRDRQGDTPYMHYCNLMFAPPCDHLKSTLSEHGRLIFKKQKQKLLTKAIKRQPAADRKRWDYIKAGGQSGKGKPKRAIFLSEKTERTQKSKTD